VTPSLLDLPVSALLDRFASTDPTPGGGSAAALSGALGAALVTMVSAMPKTRSGAPAERRRLDVASGWAREAGARLRELVDEDARAYDAVVAAYRLPKGTEGERASRAAAIGEALGRATDVPMRTAEACLVVLRAASEVSTHGNRNALSDARTGAALAWAGLQGAAENVRTNVSAGPERGPALAEQLEALVSEGRHHAASVGSG
jgi:formiminotetrahydrofolate cyclodeaminase